MPSVAVLRYTKISQNADISILFTLMITYIFLGKKQETSILSFILTLAFLQNLKKSR